MVGLFRQRPGFDSVKFVNSLVAVYSGSKIEAGSQSFDYLLMEKYKQNEPAIRKSLQYLKTKNIDALVKKRLRPFYEPGFKLDTIALNYVYLFIDEGTGGVPGYVFNSALQTALLPADVIDIITAHEAYHTITSGIFNARYSRAFNGAELTDHEQQLLWYLEIVAEEGMADLVDKPILASRKTGLSDEYNRLRENEYSRAQQKISLLDSLLAAGANNKFSAFNVSSVLENGGHIPGRYMALQIRKANFNDYLKHTGNPFQFFYHYQDAVKGSRDNPQFSEKAMAALKQLEEKIKGLK